MPAKIHLLYIPVFPVGEEKYAHLVNYHCTLAIDRFALLQEETELVAYLRGLLREDILKARGAEHNEKLTDISLRFFGREGTPELPFQGKMEGGEGCINHASALYHDVTRAVCFFVMRHEEVGPYFSPSVRAMSHEYERANGVGTSAYVPTGVTGLAASE
jgi:hypothetical protein